MPRVIGNVQDGDCHSNVATKLRKSAIKKEVENPGEQQVFHRKSERRRVARDIFLVFEEQPSRRARGSHKKKGLQKTKFGHLKVDEPIRNKCLLRDIKNECCLGPKNQTNSSSTSIAAEKQINMVQTETNDDQIARVNPIFLWVKQDDTRIVEVRCEDYDKRNRIRITKTTNGWRAIPRTDPSSSKIVKVFQTPLLTVKREVHEISKNDINSKVHQLPEGHKALSNKFGGSSAKGNDIYNNCKLLKNYVAKRVENIKRKKKSKNSKSKVKNSCKSPKAGYMDNNISSHLNAVNENKMDVVSKNSKAFITNENSEVQQIVKSNCEKRDEKNNAKSTTDAREKSEPETYQDNSLQLCPKTGLFLPNNNGTEHGDLFNPALLEKSILGELSNCQVMCEKTSVDVEQITENVDADTKNLKDLLDDADLLQHCGDNAINDTEIIDSLVKRSCENNLIQETDTLKESLETHIFTSNRGNLLAKIAGVEEIEQVIDTVTEPPKSLSFNEAGEIEGLNGELFQSNNYMDTFDKESIEEASDVSKKTTTTVLTITTSPLAKSKLSNIIIEDSPTDLTYKKREEICPPSESRSQCAVTSSSDVVKSPQHNELPVADTTSDTIKNLILEQFIKLNAINVISTPIAKQLQSEPIDLGKQRVPIVDTETEVSYTPTTNYIETVIIDDNSDEEPIKKRLRKTVKHTAGLEENTTPLIIDKDPDPLTQLQLLIRNTQWKVPDPILVPKDRLGAVLASPAREIPLLITTRPELRLPEAFAYPEIIQNPNILVISMAQLEAILRNEMEMEKSTAMKSQRFATPNNPETDKINKLSEIHSDEKDVPLKDTNSKCSHTESSLASDINAATLAVLNQMLWLPYFGQLSQEFLKTLKSPMGVQSKYSLLPLYNHHLGLQHLDELYKSYMKQISSLKNLNEETANNCLISSPNNIGPFPSPVGVTVFQKLLQHQMHNFLNMNPLNTDVIQKETVLKNSSNEVSSLIENSNSVEDKQSMKSQPKSGQIASKLKHNGSVSLAEGSICLKSIEPVCGNSLTENPNINKYRCLQKQESENKPRLTCKSLSNLLEPETVTLPAAALVNLSSDIRNMTRRANGKDLENKSINKETSFLQTSDSVTFTNGNGRLEKVAPSLNSAHELTKQRKRNLGYIETTSTEQMPRNTEFLNVDHNPALWHPLFGSNTKTAYSSPWQWTTVTATGE